MYSLYCEGRENPVSRTLYEGEFRKMNFSFKERKKDMCHKCDFDVHHREADSAYLSKYNDKGLAKSDPTCLPTPDIQILNTFYKRLYSTYNITIHDCATGHKALAKRGVNEIASCLHKELMSLPNTVKKFILNSDTYGGQSKKIPTLLICLHLYFKRNKLFWKFTIHFLSPATREWSAVLIILQLRSRKRKPKTLSLIHMTGPHKLDAQERNPEKKDVNDTIFLWRDCQWLSHSSAIVSVGLKKSLNTEDPFQYLSMKRRRHQ
ncbi:hypothetical protein PR048_025648 [Dryococelus australis]|uniref:Uncharacterized protein n=1 Tax=Dryococelus australis TaxID=614101 RepID=A0ABQ9GJ46_9NEOP|nr:hypothetical protein PR048_025648 [Dryococelus australis]